MASLVIFSQDATQTYTNLEGDVYRKWWKNPKLQLFTLHTKCSI